MHNSCAQSSNFILCLIRNTGDTREIGTKAVRADGIYLPIYAKKLQDLQSFGSDESLWWNSATL